MNARALSGASASSSSIPHAQCPGQNSSNGASSFGGIGSRRRRHAASLVFAVASSASSSSTEPPRGFWPRTWEEPVATASVIPAPLSLSGQALRSNWNATALAYLGDAVWELYARRAHFAPPKRLTALYDSVTASVRAEAQAAFAERLEAGGFLSEPERDVLRWGRNAKVTVPKRFVGGKAKDNGPRGRRKKDEGKAASASSASATAPSPSTKTVVSGPHANVYRSATALECLVGYLYVTDSRRLHALMRYLGLGGPEDEEGGLAAAVLAAAAASVGGERGEGSVIIISNGDNNDTGST